MMCNNCGWMNAAGTQRCEKCNQPLTPTADIQPNKTTGAGDLPKAHIENCPECGYNLDQNATTCPSCGWSGQTSEAESQPSATHIDTRKTVTFTNNSLDKLVKDAVSDTKKTTVIDNDSLNTILNNTPSSNNKRTVVVNLDSIESEQPKANTHIAKQTVREIPRELMEELKNDVNQVAEIVASSAVAKSAVTERHGLTPVEAFGDTAKPLYFEGESMTLNRANIDATNSSIAESAQAEVVCENGEWYIRNLSELKNTYICVERKTRLEKGDIVVIGNKRYIFE